MSLIDHLEFGIIQNLQRYSKALSYTGLADAQFLIGSKIISDTRIYVVKNLKLHGFLHLPY